MKLSFNNACKETSFWKVELVNWSRNTQNWRKSTKVSNKLYFNSRMVEFSNSQEFLRAFKTINNSLNCRKKFIQHDKLCNHRLLRNQENTVVESVQAQDTEIQVVLIKRMSIDTNHRIIQSNNNQKTTQTAFIWCLPMLMQQKRKVLCLQHNKIVTFSLLQVKQFLLETLNT